MSESSPTYEPADARPTAPGWELTIHEHELRRLQGAIEAISAGNVQVRLGLNGERPRICQCGLLAIEKAIVTAAEVIRGFRPADARPDLTEKYIAQVIDDLGYVQTLAEQTAVAIPERIGASVARASVARARVYLNLALRAMREEVGVTR